MDPISKDVAAVLLRKVADAIKRLKPADWEAVLAGNFMVEIQANGASSHRPPSGKGTLSAQDLADLRQALNEAQSRESALALLEERCPSKEALLRLSRYLDLPGQKREAREKLQERIVEGTVGFRLRSRAVQGEPPTGSMTSPPAGPATPETGERGGTPGVRVERRVSGTESSVAQPIGHAANSAYNERDTAP